MIPKSPSSPAGGRAQDEASWLQVSKARPLSGGRAAATFRETPLWVAPGGPKVFLGIFSAPGNIRRRTAWRESGCGKGLLAAGLQYAFVIGEPLDRGHDLTSHAQAGQYTHSETKLEEELSKESEQFDDIMFIPVKDAYQATVNKLLGIYSHGYSQIGAQYIMKADDEYCVQHKVLLASIAMHEAAEERAEFYAGVYLFAGTEYESMRGPHGHVAPYFSGHGNVLSRGLVKLILEDDTEHTVLSGMYSTAGEDSILGHWIKYAKAAHGVKVDFETVPGLLSQELSE